MRGFHSEEAKFAQLAARVKSFAAVARRFALRRSGFLVRHSLGDGGTPDVRPRHVGDKPRPTTPNHSRSASIDSLPSTSDFPPPNRHEKPADRPQLFHPAVLPAAA